MSSIIREVGGIKPGSRIVRLSARKLASPVRYFMWRLEVTRDKSGLGSLRFQPWESPAANGDLRRACRLLGFIRRDDFTTLYVHTRDPELARADAVVTTPLLYLGF